MMASSLDCKSVALTNGPAHHASKVHARQSAETITIQLSTFAPTVDVTFITSTHNILGCCRTGLIITLLSFNHVPSFMGIIKGYFYRPNALPYTK